MQVTREVAEIINSVVVLAKNRHYELVTPELVLYVICGNKIFAERSRTAAETFRSCRSSWKAILMNT